MATVTRDGRTYLYRSVRRKGRVTSQYRGSGDFAHLLARIEALERDEKDIERERFQAEQRRLDAIEQATDDLFERVELIVRGALLASGLRQHNRGEWRRRRERSCTD